MYVRWMGKLVTSATTFQTDEALARPTSPEPKHFGTLALRYTGHLGKMAPR